MHADRVRLRRPRLVLGHAETNAACPAKAAAVHGAAAIRATTLDEAQTRRHPPRRAAAGPSPFTYVIPISVDAQLLACVPAGGGLFRADITGVNGIARKSATASAASLIPTLTCGVSADAVFLAGQLHGEHITVGACNAPQAALNVCTTRAQMLARKLELGELAPIWCTLDALAEGLDTGSDVDDNATQGHTYLAAAVGHRAHALSRGPRRHHAHASTSASGQTLAAQ